MRARPRLGLQRSPRSASTAGIFTLGDRLRAARSADAHDLLCDSRDACLSALFGGGIVYLVLFIYGLVIDHDSSANFVPVNDADNWLHLGLAVAMIALGAALGRTREDTGRPVGTDSRTQNSTSNGPVR